MTVRVPKRGWGHKKTRPPCYDEQVLNHSAPDLIEEVEDTTERTVGVRRILDELDLIPYQVLAARRCA